MSTVKKEFSGNEPCEAVGANGLLDEEETEVLTFLPVTPRDKCNIRS